MFVLLILTSTLFTHSTEPLNPLEIQEACKSLVNRILTEEPNGRKMYRSPSFKRKLRRSFPKKVRLCKKIARKALHFFRFEKNKNKLTLASIAIAYRESQFRAGLVSPKGAIGPMQVMPHLWCNKPRCDKIGAGLLAFGTYYQKNKRSLCRTLIRYNSGKKRDCKVGVVSYSYAKRILGLVENITPKKKLLALQEELESLDKELKRLQKNLSKLAERHKNRAKRIEILYMGVFGQKPLYAKKAE